MTTLADSLQASARALAAARRVAALPARAYALSDPTRAYRAELAVERLEIKVRSICRRLRRERRRNPNPKEAPWKDGLIVPEF